MSIYMRWMKFILVALFFFVTGFISGMITKKNDKEINLLHKHMEKLSWYFRILNMWIEMKQNEKSVVTYLRQKGINRIAIYGMRELGERFYEEVRNTGIEVVCIIDKIPDLVVGDFMVISPKQKIPEVDAIIVTADFYYQEIKKELKLKVNCPVYSLSGVIGNSFGRYL